MGASLMLPSILNAAPVPVAFPPLSPPDVFNCDDYYSYQGPVLLSDCQIAFRNLPSGNVPTLWYNKPAAGEQRNLLPLSVRHGTCEIIFHTSGQSAETLDHVSIVPNDIKAMAAWVLKECGPANKGGMVTKNLQKTMDAINNAGTGQMFPDPALPPSSSFYSLHIWKPLATGDIDWNPGNNDQSVGLAIDESLIKAEEAAPSGSPARTELTRREEYLFKAVGRMDQREPSTNWWDGPGRLATSSSTS